jgi:hypothetical protein
MTWTPDGSPTPRHTDWLTVGRKLTCPSETVNVIRISNGVQWRLIKECASVCMRISGQAQAATCYRGQRTSYEVGTDQRRKVFLPYRISWRIYKELHTGSHATEVTVQYRGRCTSGLGEEVPKCQTRRGPGFKTRKGSLQPGARRVMW